MDTSEVVTNELIQMFESGEIADFDVSDINISTVSVIYNGRKIEASWYPPFVFGRGKPRSLMIDRKSLSVSGDQAHRIIRAAQRRSARLAAEQLSKLSA